MFDTKRHRVEISEQILNDRPVNMVTDGPTNSNEIEKTQ